MDYSKNTGVKIMTPIARAAGCAYQPFAQMKLLASVQTQTERHFSLEHGANGVCYGLSVAWIEATMRNNANFLDQVADIKDSSMFYRAYMAHRHQQGYRGLSTSGIWSPHATHKVDDKSHHEFFGDAALVQGTGLRHTEKSRSFALTHAGMAALCTWICAASEKRYFMVSVPKHAMAAIGSRTGKISFFDPNCGIVSSWSARALAKCLFGYFNHPTIKTEYKDVGDSDWLSAEKFKF